MENKSMNDQFWLENPRILFNSDNFYKIIPTKSMTQYEVLNTLTRLFFIYCIINIIILDT